MKHESAFQFEKGEREKRDDPYGQKFQAMPAPTAAIRLHGHPKLLNHAFPCRNGYVLIGFQNDPRRAIFPLGLQSRDGFFRFAGMGGLQDTGDPSRPHELPVVQRLASFSDWIAYAQEWVRTSVDGQPGRLA